MKLLFIAAATLALSLTSNAHATTVNIDLEAGSGGTAHVGADGPLSSAGGTFWNQVVSGTNTADLRDEFGATTGVNIRFSSSGGESFTDIGINDLQDSGAQGSFVLYGLDASSLYTLAVYVGENGGFNLEHASDTDSFFFADPGADGWSLPGSVSIPSGPRGDYYLIRDLAPANLGGGDFGFSFSTDGTVTGIQVVVPEPSTLLLMSLGLIGLAATRRGGRS